MFPDCIWHQAYSLRVVAFCRQHCAGRLPHTDLVGSGTDGRSGRGLELPAAHHQLCLAIRGSRPRKELHEIRKNIQYHP